MPYRAPTLTVPPSPRRRRQTLAVGALAAGAVAVGAVVAARRTGRLTTTIVPVTPLVRMPWPGQARAWTVHRAEDGGRQIVYGPLRFVYTASRTVEPAAVRFEASIIAAVPVATGWVFVTTAGALAASENFLGTPRPLGQFPCAFKVARDSVGRAVLIGTDGSLWTTDGTAPLVHSRLPGEVRAATFMDGSHGAAVLRDGRVLLTADAGQTWDRFVLGNDVAWSVWPDQGGVALGTTRGREVFRWEGAGVPGQPGVSRPPRTQEPPEVEQRLGRFIHSRDERFVPAGAIARCAANAVAPEPARVPEPRRYVCRAAHPLPPLALLPLAYRRNVDSSDLMTGTESGPVRGRFWRTRPDVTGETLVRMTWMGVDAGGPYHGVTSPSGRGLAVHWPLEQRGPLRVEASSRRGVLVATQDRPTEPILAWGTPERPFVRVRDPFVEQSLPGTRSFFVPSPDGGVAVAFSTVLFEAASDTWSTGYSERNPQVGAVLEIGVDGAVQRRRGFIGDESPVAMIARDAASVGPVVRDDTTASRWRVVPTDGGHGVELPSFRWQNVAACAGSRVADATLTVAYPPIVLDRAGTDPEPTVVSRADLEVSHGAVCVRALSLAGRRLTALPGDRFTGALRCDPAGAP